MRSRRVCKTGGVYLQCSVKPWKGWSREGAASSMVYKQMPVTGCGHARERERLWTASVFLE